MKMQTQPRLNLHIWDILKRCLRLQVDSMCSRTWAANQAQWDEEKFQIKIQMQMLKCWRWKIHYTRRENAIKVELDAFCIRIVVKSFQKPWRCWYLINVPSNHPQPTRLLRLKFVRSSLVYWVGRAIWLAFHSRRYWDFHHKCPVYNLKCLFHGQPPSKSPLAPDKKWINCHHLNFFNTLLSFWCT